MQKFSLGQNIVAQIAGTKSLINTDFKTGEPKVNDKGLQQYTVNVLMPGQYKYEQLPVKVYAKEDPLTGSEIGDSIELADVSILIGTLTNEGKQKQQFWSVAAESATLKKSKA